MAPIQAEAVPSSPPVRLEYHAPDAPDVGTRGRRGRVATLIGLLPGLVVPFVPFACNAAPGGVLVKGAAELVTNGSLELDEWAIWLTSIPFVLVFPLVLWLLRRLRGRRPTLLGRAAGLVIGAGAGAALIGALVLFAGNTDGVYARAVVAGAALGMALVLTLAAVLLARPGRADDAVEVMLFGPYAVGLGFCLAAWFNDARVGWYLALPPAATAAVATAAVGRAGWRRRASAASG